MLDIILNETKIVDDFEKNCELPKNIKITNVIYLLIKKCYIDGKDKDESYTYIMESLQKALDKDFIYTKWNKTIRGMVNKFSKYVKINDIKVKMVDIKEITISKTELDKISELNDMVLEKLSFILLVYAKINYLQSLQGKENKKDYWVNKPLTTIFKEAKVGLKGVEQKKKINELYNKKYIGMSKMNNKISMKINFVDKGDIEGEDNLVITDFDGVVHQYLIWKGQKWKKCEECEKWIRINGVKDNSKKYCGSCAKLEKTKKTIENRKKLKSK